MGDTPRRRPTIRTIVRTAFVLASWLCVAVSCCLLLAVIVPIDNYVLDLVRQAAWRSWLLALVGGGLACVVRSWWPAGLCVVVVLCGLVLNRLAAAPSALRYSGSDENQRVRIVFANAGPPGTDVARLFSWIHAVEPDVVALVETGNYHLGAFDAFGDAYTNRVVQQTGLAWRRLVLSALPILGTGLPDVEQPRNMSFTERRSPTVVVGEDTRLTLTVLHPMSPRNPEAWRNGLTRLRLEGSAIATYVERTGAAFVAVGDFNTTPHGAYAREFRAASGLLPVAPTVLSGTWPSSLPRWLSLPIDGLWVTPGVEVVSYTVSPRFDGDHRAVLVELHVPETVQ